jgi:hypothetical protein
MPAAGELKPGATRPRRTLLPIVLWSAGIVLLMVLIWAATRSWLDVRETDAIIRDVRPAPMSGGPAPGERVISPESAIEMLGGKDEAVRKLGLYLQWPRSLPPRRPDEAGRWSALSLIAQCGPAALGPVVRASRDRDPHVREAAAYVIGSVSRDAALPVLTRLLEDPEQSVRCAAVKSLGDLKPEPGVAVPLFVKCLGDADSSVRWHAANALRGIGPPAKPAAPLLEKLLQDEDAQVRHVAGEALKEVRRQGGADSPQW